MKILVTGGSGFVGSHLLPELSNHGHAVHATTRSNASAGEEVQWHTLDLTCNDAKLDTLLHHVDTVIHLASLAHASEEQIDTARYWQLNLEGTRKLLDAAAAADVRRFIYLSSIKALGEGGSARGEAYNEASIPEPIDIYGKSKRRTEQLVQSFCRNAGMDHVILRPPLVYGPGVRANFLKLLEAVYTRKPLPLASINNQRSLIYVANLCDVIRLCVEHHDPIDDTFLVSDHTVSTSELIAEIGRQMNISPRLLPCPVMVLKFLASLAGKKALYQRLAGDLVIDSSRFRTAFNWSPRYEFSQGIADTVSWFLDARERQQRV